MNLTLNCRLFKKGPKIVDKKGWEIYGQLLCVFAVVIFILLVEELLL